MVGAFLRLYSARLTMTGWRGVLWLGIAAAILVALPEARAVLALGLAGGVVIGAFLILIRHQGRPSGPRRGTPITLFPRAVNLSPNGA
jgi:hypothetical protein